jgi:hypothetical protein
MADHKETCPKKADATKECNCGADDPQTKKCPDCDAEVGKSEKTCPKCKLNFEDAEQETGVVEKALARIAKKNKEKKPPKPNDPPKDASKRKSVFSSLNRFKK